MREYVILESRETVRTSRSIGGVKAPAELASTHIVTATLPDRAAQELQRDPSVIGIAPLMPISIVEPLVREDADVASNCWGITAVAADLSPYDGTDVTIAIIDTGIDATHEAFSGVTILEKDFSGSGNGDADGHGTHCAGTAFGRAVNGVRIGVAPGTGRALIAKVFPHDTDGNSEMVFRAMHWAIESGANVISMSLGFDFPGMVRTLVADGWPIAQATSNALEHYRENLLMFDALMRINEASRPFGRGAVVIAAAGNESLRNVAPNFRIAASLPAAATGVISVAAARLDLDHYAITDFSNSRPKITGPGAKILSARKGGGLCSMDGTSMACPHVAGVAALWWHATIEGGVRPNAEIVTAKMYSNARTDRFATGFDSSDMGLGMATAPLGS